MIQITHHPTLEIIGFRTEAEDIETPSFVSDWWWWNILMSQLATRSRKMRAGKARKIDAISIYLQHLKAEDVQLLECNYFKSDYCR